MKLSRSAYIRRAVERMNRETRASTRARRLAHVSRKVRRNSTKVIVAGWVLLSWRYGAYVLPSPLAVARGFVDIVATGEIWRHTLASLGRILVGFGGAVVVALLAGLASFLSRTARGVIHDFLSVL